MPITLYSQYDDSLLKAELNLLKKVGVNEVSVFGVRCEHCEWGAENEFYFIYNSSSLATVKKIVILVENYRAQKIFDTVFQCNDCAVITDYVSNNYDSLHKNLGSSNIVFPTYVDDRILFEVDALQGRYFYFGVYSRDVFDYDILPIDKPINYLYKYHPECWVFISLLKNQFSVCR